MLKIVLWILLVFEVCYSIKTSNNFLDDELQKLQKNRMLMGIQLQITNRTNILYHGNFGLRDNINPIQNQTMFRAASLSKSVTTTGLMLLIENNTISLNDSISTLLGFNITNPYFPNIPITLQMILTHQSSLNQCDPYYSNFLDATYTAKTGYQVPSLQQILVPNGTFYHQCNFLNYPPGTYYQYVNLNFGIAGTIIEMITGIRFDYYMHDHILQYISVGLIQNATFNPFNITNSEHLGTCFRGSGGKWIPQVDYYPDGKIPEKNLTGYRIGTNGVIFGPQGSMRASVSHLSNYITMIANKGVTKQGKRVLSTASVEQMLKPRYQFHGKAFGSQMDFHTYGFGLYTTTYRTTDSIITHQVVKGHTGQSYGLISAYYFWNNYTLTYIVNGAFNGYEQGTGTIYERERMLICALVEQYINSLA